MVHKDQQADAKSILIIYCIITFTSDNIVTKPRRKLVENPEDHGGTEALQQYLSGPCNPKHQEEMMKPLIWYIISIILSPVKTNAHNQDQCV